MTRHYSLGERVHMSSWTLLASDPTVWWAMEDFVLEDQR
jgi:hypothetical protein